MRNLLLLVILVLSISSIPSFAEEYRDVTPKYRVKFPDDLYYKEDYRVQWWYLTGHLFSEEGREFGYELTFFAVGVQKREYRSRFGLNAVFISHFAITDRFGGAYHYKDESEGGAFGFAGADGERLRVWTGDDYLEGSMEKMHIRAAEDDMILNLFLEPEKPVVLHGDKGYSRKSEEFPLVASIYFSLTNLKTFGSLTLGDRVINLKGKSWFDREISSRALPDDMEGWDWFSIQLDDGREIMLYLMRKKDGSFDNFSAGTFVYRNGSYVHLEKNNFDVTVLDYFRSKKTGARYPARWRITIPSENINITITPHMKDQEFLGTYSTWNYYWEGACDVEGTHRGRAYVELTGY